MIRTTPPALRVGAMVVTPPGVAAACTGRGDGDSFVQIAPHLFAGPCAWRRSAAVGRARMVVWLAVVVGVLVNGAPATAGAPVRRTTLGSVLRLTGSGGAFEYVRIARPLGRPQEAKITASGDAGRVAVMLVAETDLRREPPNIIVDRLPLALGGSWGITMYGVDAGGRPVLPAGNYRAYLIAGSRTTVSIHLPGQTGGTTPVTTRIKVGYRISELPAQQVAGQYRPIAETNETYTFRRPGMAYMLGVLDYSVMEDYRIGGCFYEGEPPPGESVAQVCAGGTSFGTGGGYIVPTTTPNRILGGLITLPVQPRTVSFGLYYRFAGVLTGVRQFNLWVEYLP